jgi:prolyl-tRNA editing enzyme YbaK/EbsC (Cys-tRNA(Pro) deacylase)
MTSVDEAGALGMAADEVVRTLVLDAAAGHALAVLPATRRLDTKVAREAVGDPHARLASGEELTRDFVGFELDALPHGIGPRSNRRSLPRRIDRRCGPQPWVRSVDHA